MCLNAINKSIFKFDFFYKMDYYENFNIFSIYFIFMKLLSFQSSISKIFYKTILKLLLIKIIYSINIMKDMKNRMWTINSL